MARQPIDPTLHLLAKEAGALPFPYREPVEDSPKGIMLWPSGRGMYSFLRIGGRTFVLGTFNNLQSGAAQQYVDACRFWFAPYLRARHGAEGKDACFNFTADDAALLLSTVPGLEDLLCRLENHLRAEFDAGRPGLPDRDLAKANQEAQSRLRRSPTKRLNSSVELFSAKQEEFRETLGHLAHRIAEVKQAQLEAKQWQADFLKRFEALDLILRKQYAAS